MMDVLLRAVGWEITIFVSFWVSLEGWEVGIIVLFAQTHMRKHTHTHHYPSVRTVPRFFHPQGRGESSHPANQRTSLVL